MKLLIITTVLNIALVCAGRAEEWTRFRGPNGSGVSADSGFPVEFGKNKNIAWRTPVRPGKSSPVLNARNVFLTGFEGGKLYTQCFDRATGKLLWERSEDRPRDQFVNLLNHPAAPSPVTDGQNVFVFFKDFGLISYDAAGKLRWKTPIGPFENTMGLGASPILAKDSIILLADQIHDSFIAAFDRRNGEMHWKIARDESEAWGSPLFYEPRGGAPQVLTASRGQFGAHLVANGKRTTTHRGIATTIVASPIMREDTVFVFGYGSDEPAPFSTRLERLDKNKDGQLTPDEYGADAFLHGIGKHMGNRDGIVTKDKWDAKQPAVLGPNCLLALKLERDSGDAIRVRELWRYDKGFNGVIPSPLYYNGVVYVVKNGGILTSFDAQTGKVLKTGRVTGALGGYSSSPVAADGKIFLANEDGAVAVLRAGGDWEVLAVHELGESIFATPALSQGQIYLRTSDALYRFGLSK